MSFQDFDPTAQTYASVARSTANEIAILAGGFHKHRGPQTVRRRPPASPQAGPLHHIIVTTLRSRNSPSVADLRRTWRSKAPFPCTSTSCCPCVANQHRSFVRLVRMMRLSPADCTGQCTYSKLICDQSGRSPS